MGDLTANFSEREFRERLGVIPLILLPAVPLEFRHNLVKLARFLQVARNICGKPIIIHDAYRSVAHNKSVGGVAGSHHTTCSAADVHAKGLTPTELAGIFIRVAEEKLAPGLGEIGIYPTHVHISVQGPPQLFAAKGAVVPIDLVRRMRDLRSAKP